jgi:predicted DNA-binding protein
LLYTGSIKEEISLSLTTIRLDDELLQWIDEYAAFNGVTKTKVIRDILMEKMQDDEDYLDTISSIEESKNEPIISREEMLKRFGNV